MTENNVFMSGGEIVRGNNSIMIERLDVSGMLFGGFAEDGKVEKNTVELGGR